MRHANLPLQCLASSVAFAPQSSTARFLWRGISACATARPQAPRAQSWHLRCTYVPELTPPTVSRAHFGFDHGLFLSIRSRYGRGYTSLAPSAPVKAPRTRGEIELACGRTSPMTQDESTMTAIEMAAGRPTSALLGVCTHVRLSSLAWRRQGMSPRMLPAPPAQGLRFSRAPQVDTRWMASPQQPQRFGQQQSIRGTSSSQICKLTSRCYRESPCAVWPLNLNRPRHDQD